MVNTDNWPVYKSHKTVRAVKIFRIEGDVVFADNKPGLPVVAPFQVSTEYLAKHDPQPGGYFIKYKDGYESWSPAEAFENGYTRVES